MNFFDQIAGYFHRGLRAVRQRGLIATLRAAQAKVKTRMQPKPRALTFQEWLLYFQRRQEFRQQPAKEEQLSKIPKVSIIILTYNNLLISQICLYSIYCNTTYPNFEVIVVDNASTDETPAWLKTYAKAHPNLKTILNSDNRGFASGNNQAACEATGEYLLFLNNDTIVTQGWVERLVAHFKSDPTIGLVGSVTNSTGNEARIPANYTSPAEMEAFSADRANAMAGQSFDIRMLAFYCVMAQRDQYLSLGGLDERFGVGMFEDDDLAVRYHEQGLRVVCAEDVFIHHFQGASFGKLENTQYTRLFEENRRKYEKKWGREWQPYQFRQEAPFLLKPPILSATQQTSDEPPNKGSRGRE